MQDTIIVAVGVAGPAGLLVRSASDFKIAQRLDDVSNRAVEDSFLALVNCHELAFESTALGKRYHLTDVGQVHYSNLRAPSRSAYFVS